MSQHFLTKKEKKKAQLKKNQMHQGLFAFARMRVRDVQNALEKKEKDARTKQKKERESGKKKAEKKDEWKEKVSTMRNRIKDKKTTSDERWNRFTAAFESGGGRARERGL